MDLETQLDLLLHIPLSIGRCKLEQWQWFSLISKVLKPLLFVNDVMCFILKAIEIDLFIIVFSGSWYRRKSTYEMGDLIQIRHWNYIREGDIG